MLFVLWILVMIPAAQGMTVATDPFTEARRQFETGRTFEPHGDFERALATYLRASEASSNNRLFDCTPLGPQELFGRRPKTAVPAGSVRLDEIRMLNFLGRRNSAQYNLALAGPKLSALSLFGDKTNLFGTYDNPAGAWCAESAYFETSNRGFRRRDARIAMPSVLSGRGNHSCESKNS